MTLLTKIRPAVAEDANALVRLGAMLVEEHHGFDPLRFLEPMPDLPERYGEFLPPRHDQPGDVVLVAQRNGAIVGYVFGAMEGFDYMSLRGPAGVIYDLLVDP